MAVSRAPTTTGRKQQQRQQAQISAMLDGGVESQWRIGRSMSSRTARDSSRTSLDTAAATAYSTTTEGLISGAWCGCVTRSGAISPPPALSSRTCSRSKKEKSGEIKYSSTADNNISALVRSYNERSVTPGGSPFRPRLSPGKVSPLVEVVPPPQASAATVVASSMAPPPAVFSMSSYLSTEKLSNAAVSSSPPVEKIKASPTLFEMMSHEQQELQQESKPPLQTISLSQQLTFQEKMKTILAGSSPGSQFNDASTSDLELTLHNKEGYSITINVHRHILVTHSRFFAAKLSDRWSKQQQQQQQQRVNPNLIEITDIEDVEIYLETLRLMYCKDIKRRLMKENVPRVLDILKLSAHIMFEGCVFACLGYLEAMPWAEDEEAKVTTLLGQLQLESVGVAADVMKRCSGLDSSNSEAVLVQLLHAVTKGTDDKARREMKALVSRMLRENVAQNKDMVDVSKDSLYRACHSCLDSLLHLFMQTKDGEDRGMLLNIARHADNLHWLVDILIDRRIADDFVRMWAHQAELAALHTQVPVMFRYEVSRLTARLCIAIGKGQVLSPKDVRYLLLQTWLQPLVEDFGWMQRCCRNLDKKVVEEGISQTILTLPMKQQQSILLSWFDRFSTSGDDCPNLQKAFEVWWRRTFTRPCSEFDGGSQPCF